MSENRKIILDIVTKANNHPTAEEIYQQIRAAGRRMSMATVYNNLNTLADEGLIRRLSVDGKSVRFDKTRRHDHMVCSVCGRIKDLMLEDLTDLFERSAGVKLQSYDLQLIYVCEQCSKTSADKVPGSNASVGRMPGSNASAGRMSDSNVSAGRMPGSNVSIGRASGANVSVSKMPGSKLPSASEAAPLEDAAAAVG
ncbi:MAG: transcriptional repressor [Lachnospiraceae bacterium]|nr:transcriptional repressor [Lachnospiraceae bacterium]